MKFTIEPDMPPRNSQFHKRITEMTPIPNTKTGLDITLECGHTVQTFGNISLTGGVLLCMACKGAADQSQGA